MRKLILQAAATALLLAALPVACSKLGLGGSTPHSAQLPTPKELHSIRYMSQGPGPNGRKVFDHLAQAKSCHDLEIAMRWDRPPDVRGGPFNDKMVYVAGGVPADLAKNSEVFIAGRIEQGQSLPSGGSVWAVKLRDGSAVQAVETAQYSEKQDEAQQGGGHATLIHPYTPGRMLCAYGVYQGDTGLGLNGHGHVPLISILFAMDRRR
jgi:hypothetical protein